MNRIKLLLLNYKFEVLAPLLFFILYLPLSLNINFYQNDDWYYYLQVEKFLRGEFKLLNDIGTSFYLQGIIGAIFSMLFGVNFLPVLTLIVSSCNVMLFSILLRIHDISKLLKIASIIIFISFPIFSYSTLGYMSENYSLLFALLSVLFFVLYLKMVEKKFLFLFLSLFFVFCGFLIKQNVVVVYLAYSLLLFANKKIRMALLCLITFGLTYTFYQTIFPQTLYMKNSKLIIEGLLPLNVIFFTYTSLSYFSVLMIPLISFFKLNNKFKLSKTIFLKVLIFVCLFVIFVYLYSIYSTFKVHPYFGNTFGHLGYLYGSIEGTKPVAFLMSRMFIFYTQLAPIILTIFIFYIANNIDLHRRKNNKILLIFLLLFCAMHFPNLLLLKYFDRYLLIPFVFILLLFINLINKNKLNLKLGIFVIPFLLINFYISYLFSWDFVLTNNYVWQKSEEIIKNEKILPEFIYANGAWIEKYNTKKMEQCQYIFNYDYPLKNNLDKKFILVEKREFNELKPFYKHSTIYLYRKLTL